MAFEFPDSPAVNDTYSVGSRTFKWTGSQWILTGGVITSAQLAADSVTSAKITDGAIVNADINAAAAIAYSKLNLSNSIVAGDITSGAVTAAKLANTAVTAGSYTATNITVDAQGRITSASSGTGFDSHDDQVFLATQIWG